MEKRVEKKLTAYFDEAVSEAAPRFLGGFARSFVVQTQVKHAKKEYMQIIKRKGEISRRFSSVP